MMRQQCCRKVMDEPIMTQDLGCGNRSPTPSTQQHTTSDYFSDSLNRHSGRQLVTDLTTHASPLVDFGRKEREYIGKVVQITCQRTTLLRKNRPSTLHTNDQQRVPNEGANFLMLTTWTPDNVVVGKCTVSSELQVFNSCLHIVTPCAWSCSLLAVNRVTLSRDDLGLMSSLSPPLTLCWNSHNSLYTNRT